MRPEEPKEAEEQSRLNLLFKTERAQGVQFDPPKGKEMLIGVSAGYHWTRAIKGAVAGEDDSGGSFRETKDSHK